MLHGEFELSGRTISASSKENGRKELMLSALSRCSQGKCSQKQFCFFSLLVLSSNLSKEKLLTWFWTGNRGFLCVEYGDSINERLAHRGPNRRPFFSLLAAEKIVGPRDLHVNENSHSSLRLTWMPATGRVTGYQVHLHPLLPSGQPVSEDQRQVESLSCLTEPQLWVSVFEINPLLGLLMAQPGLEMAPCPSATPVTAQSIAINCWSCLFEGKLCRETIRSAGVSIGKEEWKENMAQTVTSSFRINKNRLIGTAPFFRYLCDTASQISPASFHNSSSCSPCCQVCSP